LLNELGGNTPRAKGEMSDRALYSSRPGLMGRFARLKKPIEIAAVIIILAATLFMYWISGHEAAYASAVCLIIAVAGLPNRFRQIKTRRRGMALRPPARTSQTNHT
jgi:hypothetical protein